MALAAFEMAEAAQTGITLDSDDTPTLFGEDQARYLVACNFDKAEALMTEAGKAGVPITTIGKFGGSDVTMGGASLPLGDLAALFRTSFQEAIG